MSRNLPITIIIACDKNYGIGKDDQMAWYLKEDLAFFKDITNNSILIFGRNTWNGLNNFSRTSLVSKNNRHIIVVSSMEDNVAIPEILTNLNISDSYTNAKKIAYNISKNTYDKYTNIYICGGSQIYQQAFIDNDVKSIYMTKINYTYNCNKFVKFMKNIDYTPHNWTISKKLSLSEHSDVVYYSRVHEEFQYLNTLETIMNTGIYMNDRTNTGIYSLFGNQMKFDCSNNTLPLLTTKKMFTKGIIKELIWFINGDTDSKNLEKDNVNIWKGNTSREYLNSYGFNDRQEGDIGPGYGHQWRHWNAPYTNCNTNYTNQGIDQLQNCINVIIKEKENGSHNRRNLMLAWNPEQIDEMSLPPCHILVQFYLENNNLSLHMYQRSADMFLGVPFNIASYAILLHIVAHYTNTNPFQLIMSFGDTHIYSNHLEAVKTQLSNQPYDFPKIKINADTFDITKIKYEDIEIIDYKCHQQIKAKMAV